MNIRRAAAALQTDYGRCGEGFYEDPMTGDCVPTNYGVKGGRGRYRQMFGRLPDDDDYPYADLDAEGDGDADGGDGGDGGGGDGG